MLLLARQAGKTFRPKALIYSPLAYYLRSAGLAVVINTEQAICQSCRRRHSGNTCAAVCPQCGGNMTVHDVKMLLATRYVEETLRQAVAGKADMTPGQALLAKTAAEVTAIQCRREEDRTRREDLEGTWRQVFSHARSLWMGMVRRNPPSLCELAVLFALAEAKVPEPSVMSNPPSQQCLQRIVVALLETSVPRENILQWSSRHLEELRGVYGVPAGVKLKPGNIGRIIFSFRKQIFRPPASE